MISALKPACRPDDFYDWIDLAGPENSHAGQLRLRWPQVLISWERQSLTREEVLEIITLYRHVKTLIQRPFLPLDRWLGSVASLWEDEMAGLPQDPVAFPQIHSKNTKIASHLTESDYDGHRVLTAHNPTASKVAIHANQEVQKPSPSRTFGNPLPQELDSASAFLPQLPPTAPWNKPWPQYEEELVAACHSICETVRKLELQKGRQPEGS